ncbi:MAG: Na+/H+ antiporter NhaC family protein [Synergistes sp.]|nr:Na+/H+ antiporter NhaC family protein [Synergistes sp.]
MFVNSFWALVPPVFAIGLALITKEVYSSLFLGVLLGALFLTGFSPVAALDTMLNKGFIAAIADNAGIFLFLVLLGAIVAIVNMTGGSEAFGELAKKKIKTKQGANLSTFLLGVLIFIDDYFNCLTVGSVMSPVTDKHKISRLKLAYIIDATAAPVCMIAPISSWAAAVSSTAKDLGTGMSGIELFIKAIPFNFYSLLTLVFIVFLSLLNFDYGKMKQFEDKALKGDLGVLDAQAGEKDTKMPGGRVMDLVFPIVVLMFFCTMGLLYVGGFFDVKSPNYMSLVGAFGDTDAFVGLPWGATISIIVTIIYACGRFSKSIPAPNIIGCLQKGFAQMTTPIIILTFAISLKSMTTALGAREFIGALMAGAANSLYSMLPAVIFLVACLLAFATGTSWGTFGILIPIVTAIFPAGSELLIIGISACLAGAVCGDHISPISDTTIMASAGARCSHVDHVATQLPYAFTVAAISFVCFVIAGITQNFLPFGMNAVVCLAIGVLITAFTLVAIKKKTAQH